jgi:Cu2+-exporting ATPase
LSAGETQARCELCQTPLVTGAVVDGRFCCAGCQRVHEVLTHLDRSAHSSYLDAARRLGVIPAGADLTGDDRAEDALPEDPSAMREERFTCSGLACPSCAWVIEQVLGASAGVAEVAIDFFSGTARLSYDQRLTSAVDLNAAIGPLGYGLASLEDPARSTVSRRATLQFAIAAVITMNIMALASVRYFEGLGVIDRAPELLTWLELLLVVPVLYLGWVPTLRRSIAALGSGRVTADLLIAAAVGAAALLSIAALVTGRDDIYFETCAGLVTISLLSQMIEARLRAGAFERLAGLLKLPVVRVRLIAGPDQRFAAVGDLGAGDRVAFEAGETVAFDGEVVGERVAVSEAVLTGEPEPLSRVAGDTIVAGSTVVEGRLEMVILRRFEETRLYAITESLVRSLDRAETRMRSADRITRWFVPAVLGLAVSSWVVRLIVFGLDHALSAEGWFPSVAVLAVACPCAFSLAGISAITAATGNLLRAGFLVKEPDQLEQLSRVGRVVLDKTGTLTSGEMELERLAWRGEARRDLLSWVLELEHRSMHPVAQAIRAWLAAEGVGAGAAAGLEIRDHEGQGRSALVQGRTFAVGSEALFDDRFDPEGLAPQHTAVWFGFDGRAEGCFLLSDSLRPDATAAVEGLKRSGLELELVSGDRQAVTVSMAGLAGIGDAAGGMSIEDKVERVRAHRRAGSEVAFVGDGTNDALAMAEASVSVALSGSTDEALTASGFVALHGKLSGLTKLFALGRRLARAIRANYVWAFAFNVLFIPVAAAGYLVPLAAMGLMLVSSTAVLINSLRLRS